MCSNMISNPEKTLDKWNNTKSIVIKLKSELLTATKLFLKINGKNINMDKARNSIKVFVYKIQ